MKKKNIRLIIIAVLLIVLVVLIPVGYALFSHTVTPDPLKPKIGKINVELVEDDWPITPDGSEVKVGETDQGEDITETYTEAGITKRDKTVHGHSTEELPSYVRIRCIPIVQYFEEDENGTEKNGNVKGNWITVPVSTEEISVIVTGDSWVQSGDYWYYKNILPGYEDTDDLHIEWEVLEVPSSIRTESAIRTNVRVLLEYAQTTNDMWKELFEISDLPQGVQRVQ